MTSQDDDLVPFGCKCQSRQGVGESSIVSIDQSIVQDDRSINAFVRQKVGEGDARDHRELLTGANAETVEGLSNCPSLEAFDRHVCSELDLGARENSVQVGLDQAYNWLEELGIGLFLNLHYHVVRHAYRIGLLFNSRLANAGCIQI